MSSTLIARPTPAGRAPHVPGLGTAPMLYKCEDVEIFAVGRHHEGDVTYTLADLEQLVRNFERYSTGSRPGFQVSVVVGHGPEESPAHGYAESVWADRRRGVLMADLAGLDPSTAEAVRSGGLHAVSIEVTPNLPAGLDGVGPILRRVCLLGSSAPAVKRLAGLPMPLLYRSRDVVRRTHPRPLVRPVRLYQETTVPATMIRRRFQSSQDHSGGLAPIEQQLRGLASKVKGAKPALLEEGIKMIREAVLVAPDEAAGAFADGSTARQSVRAAVQAASGRYFRGRKARSA